MRIARSLRVAIVVAGLVVVPANPVDAVESVTSGWWTTASTPPPPDVPPDGLLVQSTITPVAYAAASFVLGPAENPETLTLTIVEGATSNPLSLLRVCPLAERLEPAQGGPAHAAPAYDCGLFADAMPRGGEYSFDVSKLPTTGTFAVAVLPTGPVDRVVLERPEPESLSTTGADTPDLPSPTDAIDTPSSPGEDVVIPPATGSELEIGELDAPPATTAPPEPPEVSPQEEVAAPTPLGVTSPATASGLARALLGTALAIGVILWLVSGNLANSRARRDLNKVVSS